MSENASKPVPKKPTPAMLIGGGIAGAIGMVIGRYAGIMVLIPAIAGLLVGWLLSRATPEKNKPMLPASAIQAGHGVWMLVGIVLLSQFDLVLADVVILLGGAVWLAFQPGILSVVILSCYQVLGLVLNSMALAAATHNTTIHKSLTVHVSLRVAAILLMVSGLLQLAARYKQAAGTVLPRQTLDGLPAESDA